MLKRLSLYTLMLAFVPIFLWLFGFHWQESQSVGSFDHFLFWITESSGKPFFVITCAFFALVYFILIPNKKMALSVIAIMALTLGVTQGIKKVAKPFFGEVRPFMHAFFEHTNTDIDQFYLEKRKTQGQIVKAYYQMRPETKDFATQPQWLIKHRAEETNFSFPSGHSLFAATWLLLAVGFGFGLRKQAPKLKYVTAMIAVWSLLALFSRAWLGMHYPIDLLGSIFIAWLICCTLFLVVDRDNRLTIKISTYLNKFLK